MTDPERKLAGPLEEKIPTETDDWEDSPLDPSDELNIRVRVTEGERERVEGLIEQFSGKIRGSYGSTIDARMPADQLLTLADDDGVILLAEDIPPEPHVRTVSEGLEISNTDQVHTENIDGDGVKVAIIDFYFNPNNDKYGSQVVDTIGDSSYFTSDDRHHGTGCAEIVHDMAPNAELVLATTRDSNYSLFSLLDKIEQDHPDTDVLSMSLGYIAWDRLDGKDDRSQRIGDFTDDGRIAAISAGNEADGNIWHGPYQDSSGNGLMEFDGSGTEYLEINNPAAGSYVIANWDDWDEFNNLDYELNVYSDESKTNLIGSDGPNTEPYAYVYVSSSYSSAYVEIDKGANADGNQEFDISLFRAPYNMNIVNYKSSRSMSIPSMAQDTETLGVAAVQATDKGLESNAEDLKRYSSRGPTRDGRQGIGVAAPSRVSQTSNGYGSLDNYPGTGFNGTSAAAPHVAGAAAALLELDNVSNEDVREALQSAGTGIEDPNISDPSNTKIGGGYIDVQAAYDQLSGNAFVDGSVTDTQLNPIPVEDADKAEFTVEDVENDVILFENVPLENFDTLADNNTYVDTARYIPNDENTAPEYYLELRVINGLSRYRFTVSAQGYASFDARTRQLSDGEQGHQGIRLDPILSPGSYDLRQDVEGALADGSDTVRWDLEEVYDDYYEDPIEFATDFELSVANDTEVNVDAIDLAIDGQSVALSDAEPNTVFQFDGSQNGPSTPVTITATSTEPQDVTFEFTNMQNTDAVDNVENAGGTREVSYVADETTLEVSGDTVSVGGSATIDLDATKIDAVYVEQLWTDWNVTSDQPDDITDDRVGSEGRYDFAWDDTKWSMTAGLSIELPQRYVGGDFALSVTALGPDDTLSKTPTLTITE